MAIPITPRGSGKPDWTQETSRGVVLAGAGVLTANEKLVIWYKCLSATVSAYPWVEAPLAGGATTHLVDMETGIALPYVVPVGYTLQGLSSFFSFDRRIRHQAFLDTLFGVPQLLSQILSETLGINYQQEIMSIGTNFFDPLALVPHVIDITGTNLEAAANTATGTGYMILKLTKVGSPPWPKVKTVQCKWCKTLNVVDQKESVVTCQSCGKVTIVAHLPWGGIVGLQPEDVEHKEET